ncbi:MAG: hypothetical protein FJ304_15230 [Planctomycetes bacterium]|nr:hypothetical protein [Planctomycetota bacterium]
MSEQISEEEWLAPADARDLLAFVADRDAPVGAVVPAVFMSERQLRLFLVACCRARWDLITRPECRFAIEVAERFADGNADDRTLATCETIVREISETARDVLRAEQRTVRILSHASYAAWSVCLRFDILIKQHLRYGGDRDFVPLHPGLRHINADATLRGIAQALLIRR